MFGLCGNVLEGLADRAKEESIEQTRVLQRQGAQVVWQGKDDMDVWRLEYLALPRSKPRGLGDAVTFGTAAVAARVVRLALVPTVVTLRDMASKGGRATQGDGAQRPVLRAREGGPIARQKGVTMLAHDISHFQRRPTHGSFSRSAGNARASKGLSVAWSAGWATWRERLVLRRLACPSSNWMRRRSTPASSRWVAKLCLRRCGYTALVSLAARPAWVHRRATLMRVMGSVIRCPGKSQERS